MKKILCLFLALVITVCSIFAVDFTALADDVRFGADISYVDGNFDIAARKEKNESFVMIRLGYIAGGKWILDDEFKSNIEKAYNAQMDFGVYFYSYAFDTNEAKEEAAFVIDTLKSLPEEYLEYMTLPVAYDLEDKLISNYFSTANDKGKAQITKNMVAFCNAIRDAGYTPMVYANLNWFTNYIDIKTAVDNNYKLWYAYWPNKIPTEFLQPQIGSTGYYADMWQYAEGVKATGEPDKNVMYSTMGCEKHTYKSTTKTSEKATKTTSGKTVTTHTCSDCGYKYLSTSTINYVKTFTLSYTSYTYNGSQK
ncbi:MAG: hypothetical protein J1E81_09790, partial [Eubacterium sp.]|nr:hypothetical protein [Eubacterium sp.]